MHNLDVSGMTPAALRTLAGWHRRLAATLETYADTAERRSADAERARDYRRRVKMAAKEAARMIADLGHPESLSLASAALNWGLQATNLAPLMRQAVGKVEARRRETRDRLIMQAAAMGATNRQLAERFGLSRTQVSRIVTREKRRAAVPPPASLARHLRNSVTGGGACAATSP